MQRFIVGKEVVHGNFVTRQQQLSVEGGHFVCKRLRKVRSGRIRHFHDFKRKCHFGGCTVFPSQSVVGFKRYRNRVGTYFRLFVARHRVQWVFRDVVRQLVSGVVECSLVYLGFSHGKRIEFYRNAANVVRQSLSCSK